MKVLKKTPSGINGLDEITDGGLPAGRPTLICGGPGCGKTLFSMQFLVKGITDHNEPGVFVAFEEKAEELAINVASLGFDLQQLQKSNKLRLDHVHIQRNEIEETGEYDLEGLFIRLGYAIDSIGAKRVVLDTIENLFSGLSNQALIRTELRRLFGWLKDKGVTAVITAEKGDGTLTRHGLEEYVSDCVILLDHRIENQISTRRFRIVKYRGSIHGTNEYPFLINENGVIVLPVTSLKLDKKAPTSKISTGIASLDAMFSGGGYFRASTVLISGSAGTGKTSIAVSFINAACERGEKALLFSFEESPKQVVRNMKSIGLRLDKHINDGLLHVYSLRPGLFGLEMHLANIYKLVEEHQPLVVVIDPITGLGSIGLIEQINAMLLRLIDHLKSVGASLMLTALNSGMNEEIDENVSSLVDTWILMRDVEENGERNTVLFIVKSRGMAHSREVREFQITSKGAQIVDRFKNEGRVLIGSARREKQDKRS